MQCRVNEVSPLFGVSFASGIGLFENFVGGEIHGGDCVWGDAYFCSSFRREREEGVRLETCVFVIQS